MRIAYFDAFSGLSGDMTVGALLDLGVPLRALEEGLRPLGLAGVRLELGRRVRSGIEAADFRVQVDPDPAPHRRGREPEPGHKHAHRHGQRGAAPHRPYREIRDLLAAAALPPGVRDRAQRIFRVLAIAEGKVHGVAPEEVGFHEVGALDALVDVVGTAICLDALSVERIFVSSLPLGGGFARSQHGVIPVPGPATIELLRDFPVRTGDDSAGELVTPTGAAILAALATPGPAPALRPLAVGYGAGDRELADRPNLLRVVLAEEAAVVERPAGVAAVTAAPGAEPLRDAMVVLEANIDDMNPEFYEPAIEALFAAGARDVTLSPLWMKKSRPGTLLRAIVEPADAERLAALILQETSTIGVRSYPVARLTLRRERRTAASEFGPVAVKVATLPDGSRRIAPEYDDCRRIARERGLPVAAVFEAALRAARDLEAK